ncbi:MAG: MBL fold metallo-hydrolase, partial [Acidobacteriota bacterium]
MNMMVLEVADALLIIDAGVMFPGIEHLGVDIVIPDISYLKKNQSRIQAIVLTHGHEDHIGALPYVLEEINVPVYGSAFTLALARSKLEEHALLDSTDLR